MRNRFFFSGLVIALFSVLGITQVAQAAFWPGSSSASTLYSSSNVEPSGVVWHPRLNQLFFVGDEGEVIRMNVDGSSRTTWLAGGDLEGLTIADSASNYVYLALEKTNDSILEFDVSSGQLTGKSWDISSYLISGADAAHQDPNLGMEGLAFVPNGKHPYTNSNSGGLFYTGLQYNGKIYVFDVNLSSSGQFSYVDSFTPVSGRSGISDLYYSADTNILYVLFGSVLVEIRPNGEYIAEYSVPGVRQEGFTLIATCPSSTATAVIAEDTPGSVKSYASYPVNMSSSLYTYYSDADGDGLGSDTSTSICSASTPAGYVTNSSDLNDSDYDNDGVSTSSDCNDSNSSISADQTYYLDADQDSLGSDTSTAICSYAIPSGYVTNSNDLNDSDYDNDGVATANDCNDTDSTQTFGNTFYQDADGDGLGSSVSTQVCSSTAPSGYVTNSSDLNDSDYDNDGVASSTDCNDSDATLSSTTIFYQDLDGDGMGSSVTTSTCSTLAPAGYVSNSNESGDSNDLIPNAGVEISGDLRDNDGDGEIDEYNYVATNGQHPYYSLLNVNSASLATSSIVRISGATNGYIKVKYADNSIYRYRVFNQVTNRNTKVRQVNSTATLLVTAANGLKAYVNGYTGERISASSVKK